MKSRTRHFIAGLCAGSLFLVAGSVQAETPYQRVLKRLSQLEATYSNDLRIFSIGANDQGQSIAAAALNCHSRSQVSHLVVGVHHGNETHSGELALHFLQKAAALRSKGSRGFQRVLGGHCFFVVPVLNISGYNRGAREELNAQGKSIDPNRDYPDPCVQKTDYTLASTKNLSEFLKKNPAITSSITLHGYVGSFTYPWGTYAVNPKTGDDDIFRAITTKAATKDGYVTGTHAEVIYPAAGAYEDWSYHELGLWTALLEIKRGPSPSDIDKDADAMLLYFGYAPTEKSQKSMHHGACSKNRMFNRQTGRRLPPARP